MTTKQLLSNILKSKDEISKLPPLEQTKAHKNLENTYNKIIKKLKPKAIWHIQ